MRIKLFEDFTYITREGDELKYDAEWKMPGNPIREQLEEDLRMILIDLVDLGYRPQLSGFIKGAGTDPYIWIANNKSGYRPIDWDEVNPVVDTLKRYLEYNGFYTYSEILNQGKNREQIFIYFDLKEIKK